MERCQSSLSGNTTSLRMANKSAICLANAQRDTKKLSQQLLGWGMAMAFVGALYCQLVFGYLHLGSPG